MQITQQKSAANTPLKLTPSPDFMLKLKGRDIYFPSATITDDYTLEDAVADFEETSILDIPKYSSTRRAVEDYLAEAALPGVTIETVDQAIADSRAARAAAAEAARAAEAEARAAAAASETTGDTGDPDDTTPDRPPR